MCEKFQVQLTATVKEILALQKGFAGGYVERRIEVADGDLLASGNLLERADIKPLTLKEYMGVGVAGVVDRGRGNVEGVANRLLLGRGTESH